MIRHARIWLRFILAGDPDYPDEAGSPYEERGSRCVKLRQEDVTREIIGAFYDVYNALGFGFLESIYKRALEIALGKRRLSVSREFPTEVFFDGEQIGFYRIDMLVEGRVILEVEATHALVFPEFKRVLGRLAV